MENNRVKRDIFNPTIFTTPGVKLSRKEISISPGGLFLFSAGLSHSEKLTEWSHCFLSYDKKLNAIGFQPTRNDQIKGAIKFTHRFSQTSKNSSLQARSFFSCFELDLKKISSKSYPVDKISVKGKGDWLVLPLDKPIEKKKAPGYTKE